jgi:hypothetical protein
MTEANLESVTLHRLALAPFRADADAGVIRESLRQALELIRDVRLFR